MKSRPTSAATRTLTQRLTWHQTGLLALIFLVVLACTGTSHAQPAAKPEVPLLQLGVGDEIRFEVFGQQDMTSNLYIADDGTVTIPLAGAVKIAGLSPAEAATQLEKALRDGSYLVNPHVTLTVAQTRSQRVSVLGEVRLPGRYAIDSSTTVFDLLAQAGGVTPEGASTIFILRQNDNGQISRFPVNLRGFGDKQIELPVERLRAGDSVYIPRAEQFYIFGEITTPGRFSIEPDMNVLEAVARAGGVTQRGSMNRIEIKRRVGENKYKTFSADLTDKIQADDVIRIKESIF